MAEAALHASDAGLAARLAADLLALPVPERCAAADKARTCLFDFFSCAFEARDLPWSRQALASISPRPDGVAIAGADVRAAPGEAAFVNAVLGHGLVREDMHAGSVAHLGVVVWPVLLALAGEGRGGGLLEAAVVGYEVGGRLGRALITPELARLYRPTGLVGPVAGAAAAARFLGFDSRATASALALAANAAGGLNQWPATGASDMYFHPGFAARSALSAVALAAAGAEGSEAIFEGEAGFFAAYARAAAPQAIRLFPAGDAEILHVFNKPVPACNYAQTPCQAALALAGEIGASTRIRTIEIAVSRAAVRYPGCDGTGPFRRALQAKMSIPFGVAATFATGCIAEDNYARLDDGEIARLVAATRLAEEPAFTAAYPGRQGARVAVTLDDGSRRERVLDDVVFASAEEVRARFRAAAAAVLAPARAAALEAAIARLPGGEAREIAALSGLGPGEARLGAVGGRA